MIRRGQPATDPVGTTHLGTRTPLHDNPADERNANADPFARSFVGGSFIASALITTRQN